MILMDGGLPWYVDEAMSRFGYAMEPCAAPEILAGLDIAEPARRCSTDERLSSTTTLTSGGEKVKLSGQLGPMPG